MYSRQTAVFPENAFTGSAEHCRERQGAKLALKVCLGRMRVGFRLGNFISVREVESWRSKSNGNVLTYERRK